MFEITLTSYLSPYSDTTWELRKQQIKINEEDVEGLEKDDLLKICNTVYFTENKVTEHLYQNSALFYNAIKNEIAESRYSIVETFYTFSLDEENKQKLKEYLEN